MDLQELRQALEAQADAERAADMASYMRDQFRFLGVAMPEVRRAAKPTLAAGADADGDALIAFAHACWGQPEREFHYVGALLLRRRVRALQPRHLQAVRELITTKSWWDTVDSLASWTVGPLVLAHRDGDRHGLVAAMDTWVRDSNIWVARTAILHQLSYKEATDGDRLFSYALARGDDTEFFLRKALGWALRQYARVEPDRVRSFIDDNGHRLSALTKREALKRLA